MIYLYGIKKLISTTCLRNVLHSKFNSIQVDMKLVWNSVFISNIPATRVDSHYQLKVKYIGRNSILLSENVFQILRTSVLIYWGIIDKKLKFTQLDRQNDYEFAWRNNLTNSRIIFFNFKCDESWKHF